MGRYYNGDIKGKFWFGIQSSDDADFFGVYGEQPERLEYCFYEENKEEIKEGIKKCKEALGKNKDKLDKLFKKNIGYNDKQLSKETNIPIKELRQVLEWYARLELGEQILSCVENTGGCNFEAEL